MKTVAQITLFIFLSLGLHLLLLPFQFKSTAVPYNPGQVGISYVAKSLDSFYPQVAAPKTNSREVSNLPQKSPNALPNRSRQAESDDVPVVDEIKPVSSQPVIEQDLAPPAPTLTKLADPLTEKVMEKEVPVEPEPVNITTMQEPPPAELDLEDEAESPQQDLEAQYLKQTPETIESLAGEDFSSSEVMAAQGGLANAKQKPGPSLHAQDDSLTDLGSRDAFPLDINPALEYPEVAKLRGWEGDIVFEALILKNGRVDNLKIKSSSGYRSLDNAARKAVSRWRFSPATSSGIPKDSVVKIPVTFSLKDM